MKIFYQEHFFLFNIFLPFWGQGTLHYFTVCFDIPLLCMLGSLMRIWICYRFMGPYLKICLECVFVVEDGDRCCGLAVATSDSKHFYEQLKKHWLPEVCTNWNILKKKCLFWQYINVNLAKDLFLRITVW